MTDSELERARRHLLVSLTLAAPGSHVRNPSWRTSAPSTPNSPSGQAGARPRDPDAEFGPNMTTFVMPSELYPVAMRATGHGISAGIGKLGAFIGVFLFPVLNSSLGLRGTLLLTAGVSVLGMALTFVLPEPARRSLEDMTASPSAAAPQPLRVADQASSP
jgi:hypothetical protein